MALLITPGQWSDAPHTIEPSNIFTLPSAGRTAAQGKPMVNDPHCVSDA